MSVEIITADCLDALPRLAAEGFRAHAVVTDPPYGLEFMGVAWDTFSDRPNGNARPRNEWEDFGSREHPRLASEQARLVGNKNRAFQAWADTWVGLLAGCMLPGAHLVAFGSSRTYHRLVCVIEDAGFEVRDTLLWLHGQGYPKSKNQLKPAFEPIILARRPLDGTVAGNVLRHGTGALNIDACRVPAAAGDKEPIKKSFNPDARHEGYARPWMDGRPLEVKVDGLGRWPANVLHSGDAEVEEAFAPFGERASGNLSAEVQRGKFGANGIYGNADGSGVGRDYTADTGSASRFFFCAKADATDRAGSRHPTVKPTALMRWLVQLVTPPGGTVLDCFAGTGSTGLAADQLGMNAVLIERDAQYAADARRKIERDGGLFADVREPCQMAAEPPMRDLFAEAATGRWAEAAD